MSAGGEQIDLPFGTGHFIGPVYGDREFVDIADDPENPNIGLQAALAGYANGCPVAPELIDPVTGRGPEVMLDRYASVNFWFTYIAETAHERNNALHDRLTSPVPRRAEEPVGRYDPLSVAVQYEAEIPPMATLYGLALPRLLVRYMEAGASQEEMLNHLDRGLSILEQAMDTTDDPTVLLARFAERISQEDIPPIEVLQSILSAGWFKEQNAMSMIDALRSAMPDHAPTLWSTYAQMSRDERIDLGIVHADEPLPPDIVRRFFR